MKKTLAHWWDKLGGNFRSIKKELDYWRNHGHAYHAARITQNDNWLRGKEDKDGKLHAIKNYWVEFVRDCPRTTAEAVIFVTIAAITILVIL